MNFISDSFGNPFSKVIHSIQQCSGDWMLASGSETGVISLSVFGTAGNRYSILVIDKEHLSSDYACRDGKWFLIDKKEGKTQLRFDLEWAAPASGSGCLVLCGKETPVPFSSSA